MDGAKDEDFWNETKVSTFSFEEAASNSTAFAQLRKTVDDFSDVASTASEDKDLIDDLVANSSASSLVLESTTARYNISARSASPLSSRSQLDSSSLLASSSKSHQRTSSGTSGVSLTSGIEENVSSKFSGDYGRLETEYNKLKLKFEQIRREKYRAVDVKETVARLINCQPCTLEMYKSKKEKLSLVNSSLELGDGNAILNILLYLNRTLSYALFQEQMLENEILANHYLTYLRDHGKHEELVTTLFSLGRKEEAAFVEFNLATKKNDVTTKIQKLKKTIQSTFVIDANLTSECQNIVEYCDLLERQLPIETADAKLIIENKESSKLFRQFPKAASLLDQPLLTTLYYTSLYHYELPIASPASPLSLRAHYQLSDKQYCWVVSKALSRQKRWLDVEKLLTSKNFFGATKLKSPIAYDKLLSIMSQQGATPEVLSIYVRQISEYDRKLEMAYKFHCHQVVVDCLVSSKDRLALIEYRSKLVGHSPEARYAESALQNSNHKWKN